MILPYTPQESEAANKEWRATCGHHSIAAVCNVPLDAVKKACPKLTGWMSPTMISETLAALGKNPMQFKENRSMDEPPPEIQAILRIQWEGRWMKAGVPAAARYKETHYVAVVGQALVMDTAIDPNSLITWTAWVKQTDTYVAQTTRLTGWHFTHIWTPNRW